MSLSEPLCFGTDYTLVLSITIWVCRGQTLLITCAQVHKTPMSISVLIASDKLSGPASVLFVSKCLYFNVPAIATARNSDFLAWQAFQVFAHCKYFDLFELKGFIKGGFTTHS